MHVTCTIIFQILYYADDNVMVVVDNVLDEAAVSTVFRSHSQTHIAMSTVLIAASALASASFAADALDLLSSVFPPFPSPSSTSHLLASEISPRHLLETS